MERMPEIQLLGGPGGAACWLTRGSKGAAAPMNFNGNLIKRAHSHHHPPIPPSPPPQRNAYRPKQISPTILIIDVLFPFILRPSA